MKRLPFSIQKDLLLPSSAGRPLNFDLYCPQVMESCPILLFAHGFKGFKDWGHWDLMARFCAENGLAFLKFNFSHNGISPSHPADSIDLEVFGQNNFTRELQDIDSLLNALFQRPSWLPPAVDLNRLVLAGHSRGGAISIIAACRDERIKALATLAAVSDLGFLWQNAPWLEQWQKNGVIYIPNARTMQEMPLYYQLYEDYQQHGDAFRVEAQLPAYTRPMLIVHGSGDSSVPPDQAHLLHSWKPDAELVIIEGADHTFGGAHPWESKDLHPHAQTLARTLVRYVRLHF